MSKKGFVFIETIIVVTTLITILLAIYFAYSGLMTHYHRLIRYDDMSFVYKTNSVSNFLYTIRDENGNLIMENIKNVLNNDKNNSGYFINSQGNIDGNSFMNNTELTFFNKMWTKFNINTIYILNEDSQAKLVEDNNKTIKNDIKQYLNSLNFKKNECKLIIIYSENNKGEKCVDDGINNSKECTYYYTSLSMR